MHLDLINRLINDVAMLHGTSESPTRANLVEAGLFLFGHKGFEATSTRELAARAKTNVASIAYHFGGKAGLRVACARAVAERVGAVVPPDPPPEGITPAGALAEIERIAEALVALILSAPQAQDMVAFMVRELSDPGEIAALIYAEFLAPRHGAMSALWAAATGRSPQDEEVKLAVFATIGQILYFRIAQPFIERRMDWKAIGPEQTRKISALIVANLRAAIERQRI